ncbi:MAG TPA: PAS domain S-box protein [Syntrophorhabdaceae bacterium]|nr:PAS domain S-box protein [Syntrophorhabdaceae bacterium]
MMFKEEAVSDYELEICHRNGNITPVLYNASVYKDDCGRVIGIFAAARDVSERRRTELALRESEERYRTAIENASDGIALVRDDNVYAYVNRRFAEIFGYLDPNEIIDRPISLTVHEDDRRRVLEANLMSSEGNPVSSRYEFKGVKKDGTVRFIEVSLARTTYRGKAVVLQSLRDVTDYRLLEQELKQSQKMEAIGTLAGGIAHDFNNILAGIIGFSEMILDDVSEDNHPLAHRLELVLKAAERGRDLVRQILAFSRQTSYEAKEVAFARIIDEALHLLRPVLPSTIEIRKRITTYEDAVFADPAQLHQVFMNLCTNAAQAMKSKGGIIEIELSDADALESEAISRPNEKGRTYIKLTVKDTGCGIPDQNMPKIFDPFFTTKGPGEGTGLGLSVVHGIIKNHAGHVRVSSKEGEGTSFQVYLPKSEALKCTEKNVLRKISGGQERILFVDDEETLVELNRERLQRLGYEVVSTTNGPEALDIFRADPHKFDLVITDYTMPQMTGFELASAIVDMRPDLPVILCSGLHDNISYEQAGAPGLRAFISKTSGKQELADLIRKVLSE